MAANASSYIWMESVEQLARRWAQLLAARGEQPPLSADELAKRARKRSEAVRKLTGLAAEKTLETPRQWETRWDTARAEKKLKEALAKFGWSYVIVDPKNLTPQALSGIDSEAENLLIIDTVAADRRMRAFRAGGLETPVAWTEGALLQLAEELYLLAADKLGHKPSVPQIDLAGSHLFAQEIMGWPFNPWAAELLNIKTQ